MSIQDELLRSIELMIDKAIKKTIIPQDYSSVVEEKDSAGLYKVTVNGTEYWVNDGVGCSPKIGQFVYLHSPNGNMSQLYICAKK